MSLWILFQYCSFLRGVSSWDVDVNWNGRIWFGGLIIGRRCSVVNLGLIVNRHRRSRWCWRRCLQRLRGAETLLPDQHADQEEDQGNTDHGGGRGEGPMGLCWLDLVEFLEQLACVKFSIVWSGVLEWPCGCLQCWPCQTVPPACRSSPWSSSGSQWFLIRLLRSIHSPDVASWLHCDCVSWVDLMGLDHVPGLAHLVCVDGPRSVYRPGIFCQFENSLGSLLNLEFAAVLNSVGVCQVEWS